ncbi:MAG: 3-oxoacyl-ACP synthase [Lutibacter sp.]|nr:3-oxoacyl-ACP synthase [Lutibacter sp.]MBP9601996.1 3-oxoacyl-ACP synthase [Lutibacter sp.]
MKDFLHIKKLLLEACFNFVLQKEGTILQAIQSSKNDLFSETKSSAGDKHETGRAMIQLEMEKASQQLLVVTEMKDILKKLSIEKTSEIGKLGSLIKTTKGTYFLAVSIGKITVENEDYFAVSAQSPIGQQLLGSKVKNIVTFNGAEILEIV